MRPVRFPSCGRAPFYSSSCCRCSPLSPRRRPPPPARAAPAAATSRKERKEQEAKIAQLAPKYQEWLQAVAQLISEAEKKSFLDLAEDYQRDAFIDKFWRSRDPYQDTARNEFKDKWEARLDEAKSAFGRLDDDRARFLLLNGPPAARPAGGAAAGG